MRVNEERLGRLVAGRSPGQDLRLWNPSIAEALHELGRSAPSAEAAAAGHHLAQALDLDRPGATRVSLPVAARVLDEVGAWAASEVRRRLWELECRDAVVGVVCEALAGFRVDGSPRPREEREGVERALCLVTAMVVAQEEVEELEARMLDRPEEVRR
ncbi:MAG TPA: hypothetical protein VHL78_08385 [Actinomycetota bacterium]|nr:hypothetical protein [Actinomycetota bacterium]